MVDEKLLEDVKSIASTELRARKALMAGSKNVESAWTRALSHEDDGDVDEPIKKVPKGQTLASSSRPGPSREIRKMRRDRPFIPQRHGGPGRAAGTGRTQFEEDDRGQEAPHGGGKKKESGRAQSTGGAASCRARGPGEGRGH